MSPQSPEPRDFGFGPDQEMLRDLARRFLDEQLPATNLRERVAAAGDMGHHVGTYEITAGGEVVDRGKFTEIWRRQDGEWKMAADIWNSDMPAAFSGAMMIGVHEVEDADVWLAAWSGPDSRRAVFADNGAPNVRVFQSPDDPKRMALVVEVADMEAFLAFIASPEAEAAKAEDGVIDATLRLLREVE